MSCILINDENGIVVAANVIEARSFRERLQGLIGRRSLEQNTAMLIDPCRSIHMWFMRFPIDAIFLNKEMRVLKISSNLKPWQIALAPRKTCAVLEINVGQANKLKVGDQLQFNKPH